ncbi:trypsin-like serine peptidase [Devosia insulae]|uniref:trypsin-like serine peptidase n=1 Tax=Devosia insulae TaxID=408174 RepID=UPI00159F1365|nr:serine protease [Devosia insulae]
MNPLSQLLPADELARRVEERTSWTCAVSIGDKGGGTGLLVSRNVVLTNYHVILPLLRQPQLARVSSCRFDFVEDPETGDTLEGVRVPFAERWEGPSRPFSPADETGADIGFKPDELDFALIYLAEPIGEAPVARGSYRRSSRGWLPLPSEPPLPRVGAPLFIWQHPAVPESLMTSKLVVMPQKSAQGAVLSVLEAGLRLRHDVTTFHGSSGAACYDANLDLVALHHAGDPKLDANRLGKWNQAVPMRAIVAYLKREHQDLIGVVPPAPSRLMPVTLPNDRTTQESDMIEKRIRAATILMDRDSDEDGIAWARDKQNGPPGIVHVLACRHIDSHRNFLERLVRLSLAAQDEGIEIRQTREQAFLRAAAVGISGEAWQRVSLTWPPAKETPERALQLMRRDLQGIAASKHRTAVDIAVDIGSASVGREKQLVPGLAQFCASIASADRMQVFIVYYDRQATAPQNDKTLERRKQLVRMWTPENRPPGGGVCLHLGDIDSFDLGGWCRTVQGLWQGDEGTFIDEVEAVFSTGKLPMLEAERGVTPILRRNLTGSA